MLFSFTPDKIIDPSSRASGLSMESLKQIAGKLAIELSSAIVPLSEIVQ